MNGLIVIFLVAIVLLMIYKTCFIRYEQFHVNDSYKFEDFTYWWKTPPLFYPGGPTPNTPLPINQRLF